MDDPAKRSQFQWDDDDRELELRGRAQRRYAAWKIFLPGALVLVAVLAFGAFAGGNARMVAAGVGLLSAWQLFLSMSYALRRAEVEFLWPLEQRVRFQGETSATYRERARHVSVELDDLSVSARKIREVQVRSVVADDSESLTEVFLVFDYRIILVERSADRAALVQYAQQLRQRFGVEAEAASDRPITSAPTQQAGCREISVPLVGGAALGASYLLLSQLLGQLVLLAAIPLVLAAACTAGFWLYRRWLRRASRRWVQREFGLDPHPAQSDGSTASA